jgi:hypothetical protein
MAARFIHTVMRALGIGKSAEILDSHSWHEGDLAECVVAGVWFNLRNGLGPGPLQGEVFMVDAVRDVARGDGGTGPFLIFARFGRRSYDARGFRKLTPRADAADAADAAFLDQLKQIPAPLAARLERTLP